MEGAQDSFRLGNTAESYQKGRSDRGYVYFINYSRPCTYAQEVELRF
jgi:hypothetical protein